MNKDFILFILLIFIGVTAFQIEKPLLYQTTTGNVHFKSEAPLEVIEASSDELKGIIDTEKMTFAFSVMITSFEGFNSALQREHFNENYMESTIYPKATYQGKIIEKVDFTVDGTYVVRTKGTLTIHGLAQERIIRSEVEVTEGKLHVSSYFTVPLNEHNIKVPKIVNQKIAEEIEVTVDAVFEPKAE